MQPSAELIIKEAVIHDVSRVGDIYQSNNTN